MISPAVFALLPLPTLLSLMVKEGIKMTYSYNEELQSFEIKMSKDGKYGIQCITEEKIQLVEDIDIWVRENLQYFYNELTK